MAHFAKISESNDVLNVVVLDNKNCQDENGVENESIGQQFLESKLSWPANLWIQSSYNTSANQHKLGGTPLRGNWAQPGYTWDSTNEIFWPPSPYSSWVKDIATASWKSPIGDAPALTEEQQNDTVNRHWYDWNEGAQSWDYNTEVEKTETPPE
mgnify:FL=1|jgi:hypothetical protein